MIQKPHDIKSFDDVMNVFSEWFNNFGLEDLKASGVRTEAPTADTLGRGRSVIVELSGVPYIYYNNLNGVLYRKIMDAA